ncbi:MAG TPA: type II CAAX endopeptidase family protein [Chthoniobacterales bacterium]|jgi:membrane protease YdiL (CAAX protease family)
MAFDGFLPALSAVINALFLIAGIYIYVSLVRQINARVVETPAIPLRQFGWPEAFLATLLAIWFVLNIAAASAHQITSMRNRDLVENAIFSVGVLLFVAAFLRVRGLDLDSLGGFSKMGFWRTAMTGVVLMLAAYPLIFLADVVTHRFLDGASEKQAIVELFNASNSLEQRILIILLAVTVAPIAEEFLFRFFIYGVVKRYFGRTAALIVSAFLFAAVHTHLPSFGPLFVLGTCFAIAYEWSGSILVPMTMHAFFNSLTLTALAFPELIEQ